MQAGYPPDVADFTLTLTRSLLIMVLVNNKKRVLTSLAAAAALIALSGCSPENSTQPSTELNVLASFYPLQFVVEQVGGDRVTVESLTPQGAEPHDLELSPATARKINTTDLVVYQSGFQSAVDDAIAARSPKNVIDAAEHAHEETHDHSDNQEAEQLHNEVEAGHDHESEDSTSHDGHDHGATDPHFWLDPTLLADVARDVSETLITLDPDGAATYQANANALVEKLTELDTNYTQALGAQCTNRTIVVTHEAFGYLASRYHFDQLGISGIDPEAEPSPAQIRKVREQIAEANISTIFFETLTSPKVAQTLAKDLGIDTAILDPIEGLTDSNSDYFSIMEANLAALTQGMNCA